MARPLSDANIRAIEEVDKIRQKMPAALKRLIEREGIIIDEIPERVASKKGTENDLRKMGVLPQATEWRKEFASRCKLLFTGRSWNMSREIAWRLVKLKAEASLDDWLTAANITNATDSPVDPAVARLPQDIRWTYLHPALAAPGKLSPALQSAAKEYEEQNPCPNNGARNRLNSARATAKSIADFMKHVDKLLMAASTQRTRAGTVAVPAVADREEESIADLESRLFAEMDDSDLEQAIGEKAAEDGSFD